jgi:glucosylceramidase
VLFTEGCVEGGSKPGDWHVAERYATNLMGDLGAGVCGWIDWNIALDLRGGPNHVGNFCDAPVLVDTAARTVIQQPSFHAIAHFSKYVKPGAHRVALEGRVDALQALAFSNPDGTLAIVAFNPGDAPVHFNLALRTERVGCVIPGHAIQTCLAPG